MFKIDRTYKYYIYNTPLLALSFNALFIFMKLLSATGFYVVYIFYRGIILPALVVGIYTLDVLMVVLLLNTAGVIDLSHLDFIKNGTQLLKTIKELNYGN